MNSCAASIPADPKSPPRSVIMRSLPRGSGGAPWWPVTAEIKRAPNATARSSRESETPRCRRRTGVVPRHRGRSVPPHRPDRRRSNRGIRVAPWPGTFWRTCRCHAEQGDSRSADQLPSRERPSRREKHSPNPRSHVSNASPTAATSRGVIRKRMPLGSVIRVRRLSLSPEIKHVHRAP